MDESHSEADGLRILAFPCNQFGNQEPGTNEEIKTFAQDYEVKFDMFDKIDVNGDDIHPIFTYLKSKHELTLDGIIPWNWTKFIINQEGQSIAVFGPKEDPIPNVQEACKSLFMSD